MKESVGEALRAKLDEIDRQLEELQRPPSETGTISFGKRVGEGTSMAVDRLSQVGVQERLLATKADMERALAKLDEGSYGQCDACGQPIAEGRLEALPWATLCVDDAAKR